MAFKFEIEKKLTGTLGRVGVIHTPHGFIQTPAFIPVGTKATVKSLSPEQVQNLGAQAVLANTYHLYLEPGEELVRAHGGFAKMMHWHGPTFTDSGGFQVFSLGAAFGSGVSKVATTEDLARHIQDEAPKRDAKVKIDEDGVDFQSVINGSWHRFTPERSMQIQHALGADIFFAFDECTSPLAPHEYQLKAIDRTHRWAKRSLDEHIRLGVSESTGEQQALMGVVQGGSYEDLRRLSARTLGAMDFDGYGIGGSFTKDDIGTAVKWVNEELPEGKPRHLLGIGEPIDFFAGIENGIDTFDCVTATRVARNGAAYTLDGRVNLRNAKYRDDMLPIEPAMQNYTSTYTRSYIAHLLRSEEMLAATLISIHNLHFIITLVANIRTAMQEDRYWEFKEQFLARYYAKKD